MKILPDNFKMNENLKIQQISFKIKNNNNHFFFCSYDHTVAAFAGRLLVTGSLCNWILDWIRLRGDYVKRRPVEVRHFLGAPLAFISLKGKLTDPRRAIK
jgi:hypothetical protein